jgi:transcription-repair coupling factor (superfamily II helicase)
LFTIKVGDKVDTQALVARLVAYGYTRIVGHVQFAGEFASRGEVLDVMQADEDPVRILFDYDTVESIKYFDAELGTTTIAMSAEAGGAPNLREVTIRPQKEVVWGDGEISALENWIDSGARSAEGASAAASEPGDYTKTRAVLEALIERRECSGEEMFFGLCFDRRYSVLDYLRAVHAAPEQAGRPRGGVSSVSVTRPLILLQTERLANAESALRTEYASLYRGAIRDSFFPPPEALLLDYGELSARAAVKFLSLKSGIPTASSPQGSSVPQESRSQQGNAPPSSPTPHIVLSCDGARSFFGNFDFVKEEFSGLLAQGWDITVAAESDIQAERIGGLLRDLVEGDSHQPAHSSPSSSPYSRPSSYSPPSPSSLHIPALRLSQGFALPAAKILLVCEAEIFGRRTRVAKSAKTMRGEAINTFVELEPGDHVVHIQHGIGLFLGIERIKALGRERDYVKLEYADDEIVFVPIEQVNLVQRYIGNQGLPPRLDKIGSSSWEGRKSRVKKSVEDIAARLVDLYSKRKAAPGYAFPLDTEWQTMFEAAFPYEETVDQLRCVEEIKDDMERPHPMDRLVCGDVGYGKTEVALRACFKAVMGGRQVAFLAPTTILAEQHFENFTERFSQFPIRVAMLSRLVDGRAIKKTLAALARGEVDVLVGTHRIIQKDVKFKSLGLIVIDEE